MKRASSLYDSTFNVQYNIPNELSSSKSTESYQVSENKDNNWFINKQVDDVVKSKQSSLVPDHDWKTIRFDIAKDDAKNNSHLTTSLDTQTVLTNPILATLVQTDEDGHSSFSEDSLTASPVKNVSGKDIEYEKSHSPNDGIDMKTDEVLDHVMSLSLSVDASDVDNNPSHSVPSVDMLSSPQNVYTQEWLHKTMKEKT